VCGWLCASLFGILGPDERAGFFVSIRRLGSIAATPGTKGEGAAADGSADDDADLDEVKPKPEVGATCSTIRLFLASQSFTAGCWRVRSRPDTAQRLHWDGRKWRQVKSSQPGSDENTSYGVSGSRRKNVHAVGTLAETDEGGTHHLIQR
jgi:hypothetical protein